MITNSIHYAEMSRVIARKINNVTFYRVPRAGGAAIVVAGKLTLVRVRDAFARIKGLQIPPRGYDYINCGTLLGIDTNSEKLAKTAKRFGNVVSYIHYGAPFNVAGLGIHACSHASRECSKYCLNSAGKGSFPSVQLARIARTRLQFLAPILFEAKLIAEVARAKRKARRLNKSLAVRFNGTTDTMGGAFSRIIDSNPDIEFYDYTAVPSRVVFAATRSNYHITLSRKETESNRAWIVGAPAELNVAVVVAREVKATLLQDHGARCVDGDEHDLRLPSVDGAGKLILLTAKGKLRGKTGGMTHTSVESVLALRGASCKIES